jgi:hypothetical protein
MTSKIKQRLIEALDRHGFTDLDEHTHEVIEELALWFDEPRKRGICWYGDKGCGKSTLVRSLARACRWNLIQSCQLWPLWAADKTATTWRFEEEILGPTLSPHSVICLDDIGTEPTKGPYGADWDVMAYVWDLIDRHPPAAVFGSTNLDRDAMAQRYDDRTLSRMRGTMTFSRMTGPDRRTDR